jgi:hypothetical protein
MNSNSSVSGIWSFEDVENYASLLKKKRFYGIKDFIKMKIY